jgi:hypothetical protein
MQKIVMAAAFCLLPVTFYAQWLHFRQPGIPRTPDGKPDLTAPAPRSTDGKPDLSGLWAGGPSGPVPYIVDVIQDIKDEAIFKPAAEALFQKRLADLGRDWPPRHCLPIGPAHGLVGTYRIIQSPNVVALLFNSEMGDDYRQIFLDGRELPRDPNPTWQGYSVGRWEGDTLVIETTGFNDRSWLDMAGHPHSERLHMTERLRRIDFGHLQFQVTFDDPETMTMPVTLQRIRNYSADTDMLEGVCENERDTPHLVGKANKGVKLSAAVLAKYAGTYELREGEPGIPRQPITISLVHGQLYLGALLLIRQSETSFQWFDGTLFDFSQNAAETATVLRRPLGQGDQDSTSSAEPCIEGDFRCRVATPVTSFAWS